MNNWIYSETVKKHFFSPQNYLKGEKPNFRVDGVGEVGSAQCGDVMKIWIKVEDGKIVNLKWKTFGCASAIGSTSMLSEMVLEKGGMKVEDALKITPQDILERLGGLPNNKIHCSVLGDKALRKAIENYLGKQKEASKIICSCLGVSERELDLAIADGARSFVDFAKITKAGSGCGRCVEKITKMMEAKLKNLSAKPKQSCCPGCKAKCPKK